MGDLVKSFRQWTSPAQYEWLFKVRTDDPVLRWFNAHGWQVDLYEPAKSPWSDLPYHMGVLEVWLGVIVLFLWSNRASTGVVRQFAGLAGLAGIAGFSPVYGKTGIGLVDFGVPALAFLASLHLIDIFILRDPKDTADWSFSKMYVEVMAFPDADSTAKYPRLANLPPLAVNVAKAIGVNLLLYSAPAPHHVAQIKHWIPFIGYHATIGAIIMLTLGCLIESILRIQGIVFGYEMKPMFHNPLFSSNLREFWAKWDMAVKDGLHTAIFHAKAAKRKEKRAAARRASASGGGKPSAVRRAYNDNLSETDMSSVEDKPRQALSKANGAANKAAAKAKGAAQRNSGFTKKAAAASATFAFSGLAHEYMNQMAFGKAGGQAGLNFTFFMVHAAGTIVYTWLKRNKPQFANKTPWVVGMLITNLFAFGTSPLFCLPFSRAGFFEAYKAAGIFGPIRGFVWLYGK